MDYLKLSKIVSHALRHEPSLYDLELDDEGWVDVDDLILSLRRKSSEWTKLSKDDLSRMIANSSKKRHQVEGDKIRALYGHSVEGKLKKSESSPPEFLFHGTTSDKMVNILDKGILPMKRQYVHLSQNVDDAIKVASRRVSKSITVLQVESQKAYKEGVKFYKENEGIWLSDAIPSQYIIENHEVASN